jgi:hypothetical protein
LPRRAAAVEDVAKNHLRPISGNTAASRAEIVRFFAFEMGKIYKEEAACPAALMLIFKNFENISAHIEKIPFIGYNNE